MTIWRALAAWGVFFWGATLPAQTHDLTETTQRGECHRLDISLRLKGELRVNREGKTVAMPIVAGASHRFTERILEQSASGLPIKVARHYDLARAEMTVEGQAAARTIRDDRRLIVAQRVRDQFLAYSPAGPMTRDELEVISQHFDTLSLTGILPRRACAIGDSWKISNDVVQALAQFEALISHDITARLVRVADGFAEISIGGKATGIELGALVKVTVSASARFEILPKKLVRVEWVQQDERDQGPASPAATMEATTIVQRMATDTPPQLQDSALESVPAGFEVPSALTLVYHHDAQNRFDVAVSREWQLVAHTDQHLVLRCIEQGELVCQVTLTPWTKAEPGKHLTADEFRDIVAQAPGWQIEEVLEAGEIPADQGRWIYRISARGSIENTKVVQTFYIVAHPNGGQVIVTFSMKPNQVGKLGSRDLTLIGSIGFPK
jgi:hypothetical protein